MGKEIFGEQKSTTGVAEAAEHRAISHQQSSQCAQKPCV